MDNITQGGAWQMQPLNVFRDTSPSMPLSPPVIAGLLRLGETMNVIAETKIGKSWLSLDLALSVASGQQWLGCRDVRQGKVLLIDNELDSALAVRRCWDVAESRGITADKLDGRFYMVSLRGDLKDIHAIRSEVARIVQPGEFSLIVLDALYRVYPERYDENSNADATKVYNQLDAMARYTKAAIAVVHHSSKGYQGAKRNTDVGSGAGAISRAADTHLVLRATKQENIAEMTVSTRSFAPPQPTFLEWRYPLWQVTTEKPSSSKWTPATFAQAFLSTAPQTESEIRHKAQMSNVSWRDAKSMLKMCRALPQVQYQPARGSTASTYQVAGA